jgi:hypothetical protein
MSPQSAHEGLLGNTAPIAYQKILLLHPEIERLSVFSYVSPPRLQQRIAATDQEQEIIRGGLAIRDATQIPFWEAVFSHCLRTGNCTEALLTGAFFHHGQGTEKDFSRTDLEEGILERISASNQANIALGSRVLTADGRELHLGLLDFRCDIEPRNTPIVHLICRQLMPGGFVVLDSGDSYHACAFQLFSPSERIRMLGRALLVSPIVDSQYIAHQLQQDSSSIRMSLGGKARKVPTVIDTWTP